MKIAYVMSRFPLLSETFILREMIEVEKQGHEVLLYPLMCENPAILHEEAKRWLERAHCIPFFSGDIFRENIRCFIHHPLLYLSLLGKVFIGNLSSMDFLTKGLYLFPKAVYTARRFQLEGVDHIHAHYATHPALLAWIAHKLTGIPYSLTIHSHDIYDNHAMLGPKLKDSLFIATISHYNVKYMSQLLGNWVQAKCHIVRCGIDPKRFGPLQKERRDVFEVLQIGSLHWKKDQISLIRAMALLQSRNIPCHLTIIGEGEERSSLENEIRKSGLEDLVHLAGAKTQAEVAQLLPQADCYIQSSLSEGIPVALMEALACELPVVATNITGIPELIIHQQTGLLVNSGSKEAMADALEMIFHDPLHAMALGKQGRVWVMDEFDLEKNIRKLVSILTGQSSELTAQ